MPGVATGTVFLTDTHEVGSVRLPAQLHPTALYCSDCMELLCFVDYGLVPVVGIDRDLGKQGHLSGVSYYPIFANAGAVVFGDTVVGWYWNGFARVLLEGIELDSANTAARTDALTLARRVLAFIYMSNYLRLAEGEPETSKEYERLVDEVGRSPLALRLGRVLADFAELTPYEAPRSDDDL